MSTTTYLNSPPPKTPAEHHIEILTGILQELNSIQVRIQEAETYASAEGLRLPSRGLNVLNNSVRSLTPLLRLQRDIFAEQTARLMPVAAEPIAPLPLAPVPFWHAYGSLAAFLESEEWRETQLPASYQEVPNYDDWIPVHQIIPDDAVQVMCVDPDDGVVLGFRQDGVWWRDYGSPFHPTHWRDFPPLPTEITDLEP